MIALTLEICVLDGTLDSIGGAHRPRTCRAADLEFARPSQAHVRKLARLELRRGQQERHRARVILDTEEMVPPLNEVSCEITGWLANYLHRDVMPGHMNERQQANRSGTVRTKASWELCLCRTCRQMAC